MRIKTLNKKNKLKKTFRLQSSRLFCDYVSTAQTAQMQIGLWPSVACWNMSWMQCYESKGRVMRVLQFTFLFSHKHLRTGFNHILKAVLLHVWDLTGLRHILYLAADWVTGPVLVVEKSCSCEECNVCVCVCVCFMCVCVCVVCVMYSGLFMTFWSILGLCKSELYKRSSVIS